MVVLCSYWLDKCGAAEVIEAARSHAFAVVGHNGTPDLVEGALYRQTREALAQLQESEERNRLLMEHATGGIIVIQDGEIVFATSQVMEVIGRSEPGQPSRSIAEVIHPDDRQMVKELLLQTVRGKKADGSHTVRIITKEGNERWVEVNMALFAWNGRPAVLAMVTNITDQKNTEEMQRTFYNRLVEVQEKERQTIARELHDELGQPLTIIKSYLDRTQPQATGETAVQLAEAGKVLGGLIHLVRNMSANLRPDMLDVLGLLPTLLWHFERYTRQTKISVNFRHTGLKRKLPPEVTNTAYRLVQEALTNVARHAQVSEVMVHIRAQRNSLTIEVQDHGTGFDLSKAAGTGIGLTGMYERAQALKGTLTIESTPGAGTYLLAELPLSKGAEKEVKTIKRGGKNSVKR